MMWVTGTYKTAVCYTGEPEGVAAEQMRAICNCAEFASCKIRIMPDVHAGMGCTIGTTMTITDKIDEIVRYISPTAEIVERVLPAYNFKAGE